jgi:excisionase family DNA binding protein
MSKSLTHSPAKMLNVKEVAVILACSARHVRRLSDSGAMPRPRHLGVLIRWSEVEIDKWIAAGCPSCRNVKGGSR